MKGEIKLYKQLEKDTREMQEKIGIEIERKRAEYAELRVALKELNEGNIYLRSV